MIYSSVICFKLTLPNMNYNVNRLNGQLNDSLLQLLKHIEGNQGINLNELSLLLGKSSSTINKQISKLKVEELIERQGGRKTGEYYFTDKE